MRFFTQWQLLVCLVAGMKVSAAETLAIFPGQFKLTGAVARQQLVVEEYRDRYGEAMSHGIQWTVSDTNVVRLEGGTAVPVGNGTARLTAKVNGRSAVAQVTVEQMDRPFTWSFRNHVQPVLAKAGCSSGACHGAAAGQNGFKLSLRGYDDEGDFTALTRGAFSRRVLPEDPGRSLMLLKPTAAVAHKGGKRFEIDSPDYRVLSEWIASGLPGPRPEDARIVRIEMLPGQAVLRPGLSQQILVRAFFNDGHAEDVTRWAKFNSANGAVAQVDDNGLVRVTGYGEGAITAWYLSRIATATMTVPFTNQVADRVFARAPRRNFIDQLVLEKLQSLNLPPSDRSGDAEFLRRAFLDTLGVLPTPVEVREFLADQSPAKRDALIEKILQRPEFVDYWSYKWSDLLLVNGRILRPAAMWSYYEWIRNQVAANTPWDEFARRVVTARGSTFENGAGNFFSLHEDPRTAAETTSQAFLGMSITCAKCHNHPMEKWTNDQYYQFANLFARVRSKNGQADGETIIFSADEGDLVQPLTGKPQPPRPLDGPAMPEGSSVDRRVVLADWLTSRSNPYFSRAIANRIWANFFGVGLVEAVDDLRVTNPASNEVLLTAAADYLASHHFDLKELMRAILRSETYQRTSAPLPGNAADTRFYSHYFPRRLMAEVLLDGLSQVTSVPGEFRIDLRNENRGLGEKYPAGLRALQLPDTKVFSYFLKTFGRPEREKTCECERTSEPNIGQILHLANGDTINQKLFQKDNRIGRWLADGLTPGKIIEEAYLSSLSRLPTAEEQRRLLPLLAAAPESEKRAAVEDMVWALLSTKEFLFNH